MNPSEGSVDLGLGEAETAGRDLWRVHFVSCCRAVEKWSVVGCVQFGCELVFGLVELFSELVQELWVGLLRFWFKVDLVVECLQSFCAGLFVGFVLLPVPSRYSFQIYFTVYFCRTILAKMVTLHDFMLSEIITDITSHSGVLSEYYYFGYVTLWVT